MKFKITAEQIDYYRKNGFIVIEDFLSPEEMALMKMPNILEKCLISY